MCLLLKKHFYRPLKMLYRYKSKWYMPPKVKTKFGLAKAKLLQKDYRKIYKKNRIKLMKELEKVKSTSNRADLTISAVTIPTLLKEKQKLSYKKKYTRTKITKIKLELKKKKRTIKKYLNNLFNENADTNSKINKIKDLVHCVIILNQFTMKTRSLTNLFLLKNLVQKKNDANLLLKKRLNNKYALSLNYFFNYTTLQNNILITAALLRKKKKMKKTYFIFKFLKIKQALIIFKLKEKENHVYNEAILDSNFLENNLREIWGKNPTKNLSDYFLAKIKNYKSVIRFFKRDTKKTFQFRLKKKSKYKKNYDKMYYKKKRIIFEERSYNRTGFHEIKHKTLKMKRRPLSLLNLSVKKEGVLLTVDQTRKDILANTKAICKIRKKKKILFLNPVRLLQKLEQQRSLKKKSDLRPVIKTKFKIFNRLIKLELKKNNKIIKKYTRKILFLKKQKGLFYRKTKIEILNLREHFIRENQKLRDEIKLYRYYWKNSPFFNYNRIKQNKLNITVALRKQKNHLFNLMSKYPEGISAFKERIKNNQYYTGLSLLKRKLEQSFGFLDLSVFIRACTLSYNTSFIFGQQRVKWVFAGPKRSNTLCGTKL